jgi:predicted DNA-binding transcriptional regulator AlpA
MFANTSSHDHGKSRIIGLAEVMARTGPSKSKIYRDMKAGKFPPQAKKLEGSSSAGWFEEHIDEFLERRRPESSPGATLVRAEEVSQAQAAESDDSHRPFQLNLRPGTAPQRQPGNAAEDESLIRTGMKLQGQDVFLHVPSRKLLVAVPATI